MPAHKGLLNDGGFRAGLPRKNLPVRNSFIKRKDMQMSLGKLTVNGRRDGFLCDGKPFFWFADTCWSAFTSITEDDWDYYLTRRAEQGMNVLQINTLPQWDR